MYKKSEIDELFYRLMGYYPTKAGQAYEIISVAALGVVKTQMAEHNRFIKGESGGRPYQLDGLLGGNIMVESKDYTIDDRKVGRTDLQKMQGALTDLKDIKEGYFTSATKYTRDAIKYAEGTRTNDFQKTITPIDVRPSTKEDKKGRIMMFAVTMIYAVPDYERGSKNIIFADGGREMIDTYMKSHGLNECSFGTGTLYDSNGNFLITIADLSRKNPPKFNNDDQYVSGSFLIEGAYIKFYDILVPVKGISYKDVPIVRGLNEFTIEARGDATLLIQSEKMGVNKLITDADLKKAIESIVGSQN